MLYYRMGETAAAQSCIGVGGRFSCGLQTKRSRFSESRAAPSLFSRDAGISSHRNVQEEREETCLRPADVVWGAPPLSGLLQWRYWLWHQQLAPTLETFSKKLVHGKNTRAWVIMWHKSVFAVELVPLTFQKKHRCTLCSVGFVFSLSLTFLIKPCQMLPKG